MAEKPPVSFDDNNAPSLTVLQESGASYGWPLHLLSQWHYTPPASVSEPGTLALWLVDKTVKVTGDELDKIAAVLAEGKGGKLQAVGERYRSQRTKGAAYIVSIEIEQAG